MNIHDILYIEKCTPNNDHSGEAHIGKVSYSKTKQTIYYKSKSLQKKNGISGNYYDIDTEEEYWISGVKSIGTNRHWAGRGNNKIIVDKEALEEFLLIVKNKVPKYYTIES
jgi:hypothetical protein